MYRVKAFKPFFGLVIGVAVLMVLFNFISSSNARDTFNDASKPRNFIQSTGLPHLKDQQKHIGEFYMKDEQGSTGKYHLKNEQKPIGEFYLKNKQLPTGKSFIKKKQKLV